LPKKPGHHQFCGDLTIDRSIHGPEDFPDNIVGTFHCAESVLLTGMELEGTGQTGSLSACIQ